MPPRRPSGTGRQKPRGGGGGWLVILLVIAALFGGGYYYFIKPRPELAGAPAVPDVPAPPPVAEAPVKVKEEPGKAAAVPEPEKN